jgi:hypothetical protein
MQMKTKNTGKKTYMNVTRHLEMEMHCKAQGNRTQTLEQKILQ